MTVTTAGRKIVDSRSRNSRLRPGNRKRANPYATRVHDIRTPIIPTTAMTTVLNRSRGYSRRSHTWLKLSKWGENTNDRGNARHDPCHVMGAALGSAGSTKVLDVRPGWSNASVRVSPLIV